MKRHGELSTIVPGKKILQIRWVGLDTHSTNGIGDDSDWVGKNTSYWTVQNGWGRYQSGGFFCSRNLSVWVVNWIMFASQKVSRSCWTSPRHLRGCFQWRKYTALWVYLNIHVHIVNIYFLYHVYRFKIYSTYEFWSLYPSHHVSWPLLCVTIMTRFGVQRHHRPSSAARCTPWHPRRLWLYPVSREWRSLLVVENFLPCYKMGPCQL